MKTEPEPFAVDLSQDGIFLWHRKPAQKWEYLGSVPLNSGNLRQQLETLKAAAQGIAAPSMNAVVRIPTAEVQTLTVAHDPNADTSWETRIVSALEAGAGASIKTLVFDIDRGGGTSDISVAWTPISVITQARIFVQLIGFTPTRYTTDLNVSAFPRSPNFHLAEHEDTSQETKPEAVAPDTQELSDEPASNPVISVTPPRPDTEVPKGNSGFVRLVVLILILAIFIAGIFYWPQLKQLTVSQVISMPDQPIIAIAKILP